MIPGFKSLDRLLLVHSPNLWCLRAHYVLPGSIIAFVAMGFLGNFVGLSLKSKSSQFEITSTIAIMICGAVCLYWCYLQARQRYSFFPKKWAGLRNFMAYPFLMALILLPAFAFDMFSGIPSRNTITGDDDTFLFVTILASFAMVVTWMYRSLSLKSIFIGAVSAIALSTIFTLLLTSMVDSSSFVTTVLLSAYAVFTVATLLALIFWNWTWATAASILISPIVGAQLAFESGIASGSDSGFIAGFCSIAGGVIICTIFQPFLNRYRTFPK